MSKLICPKCGNNLTFYTKEKYSGTCNCCFRTDGKDADNTSLYSNANHKYASKFIFCADCDAKVSKLDVY